MSRSPGMLMIKLNLWSIIRYTPWLEIQNANTNMAGKQTKTSHKPTYS